MLRTPALLVLGVLASGLSTCGQQDSVRSQDLTSTPDWVADAVFYQIFPERFRNGDPSNDPTHASLEDRERVPATWRVSDWTADWYSRDDWEIAMGDDFYRDGLRSRRYGGDLAGVIEKLDYLADLGITAIYFNPVFYARSLHKYDGNTYHHIDPFFGPDPDGDLELIAKETEDPATWHWTSADRLFLDLLATARERDIRIVIDGVWNHTGRDFFAFVDLRRNGESSRYRDWYIVKRFDDPATPEDEFDWQGWWGHKPLPEFADTPDGTDLQPGPKQYVFDACQRWMDPNGDGDPSDGIAGWRLDVVPDMPIKFWEDWNAYVRSINPNVYTVAEIWHDASEDVLRAGFSGTMNYHAFAMPVKGFLADRMMTAEVFVRLLAERAARYDPRNRYANLNLVDSHDTARLASMIVNAESSYSEPEVFDYDRDSSPRSDPDYDVRRPNDRERRIQRLVALLQATYAGPPMIYYGTEAGMWGADDPDDRMPMVWDDMVFEVQSRHPFGRPRPADTVAFDTDLFDFYRSAFRVRHDRAVLRRGNFAPTGSSDDSGVFAFTRGFKGDTVVVVVNRGEEAANIRMAALQGWTNARVAFEVSAGDVSANLDGDELEVELAPLTGAVIEGIENVGARRGRHD